ncbi:MAG: bifunctional 5,10-methylene-tetrahydrofolate dehydrogenase/5,10-methylene-tetrahydrofolate cyclohydrolase [Vicinamibacteria bacterium]|jgi:methylenetetrahydrofolate dehydrogenase (NADP+)/methenyltetrahydrofolate cyclohydrolase|nr:bifunctional 5,10-methylene-tetrahydrofolate dehydrogenase/5,10-methylene-tetrahydrofolate cyclohydrolase [Vicinamibacteria bacterium]
MSAQILDGKAVSQNVLAACEGRVRAIVEKTGVVPCLATVLVGEDPGSITYTRMKRKRCEAIGMRSVKVELPTGTTTHELVDALTRLANDPTVHGILLQHPVPKPIDERAAFEAIPVIKDADGVTLRSFAALSFGLTRTGYGYPCCTPAGIMRLLESYQIPLAGKRAVVVGRSAILGRPMAMLLLAADATVTICHSKTQDLPAVVSEADVVVAAVGRPRFVAGDWIRPGAVVVDAGANAGNIGDCDFESCVARASFITPVPGGVGPMTIAMLIEQTVAAAAQQLGVTL